MALIAGGTDIRKAVAASRPKLGPVGHCSSSAEPTVAVRPNPHWPLWPWALVEGSSLMSCSMILMQGPKLVEFCMTFGPYLVGLPMLNSRSDKLWAS